MIPGTFPFATLKKTRGSGHVIEGSGLFSPNGVLTKTLSSSDTKKWTVEAIVKIAKDGSQSTIFNGGTTNTNYTFVRFETGHNLRIRSVVGAAARVDLITTQVFRDFGAYLHIVVTYDSANATASERVKLFINGTRVTDFSTETYPSLNQVSIINSAVEHRIGTNDDSSLDFDGYLSRITFIDGQVLAPTDFGEVTTDGFWQINDASDLTFGTNGFLLEGGTDVAAGTDSSGNSNSFTKSGTITATSDSPTDDADNGYGNLATFSGMLHGITGAGSGILVASNGGRTYGVGVTNGSPTALASIPIPPGSLIYCEVDLDSVNTSYGAQSVGIMEADFEDKYQDYGGGGIGKGGAELSCSGYYTKYRTSVYDGTRTDITGTSRPTSGDRVRIAVDTVNDEIFFGLEAAWFNGTTAATGGDPAASTGGLSITTGKDWLIGGTCINGQHTWYFDEADWEQTAPTGYTSLSTANLPTPAVANYEDEYYIEAGISHTNGATTAVTLPKSVSGGAMVRLKRTDSTSQWMYFDTTRGANVFSEVPLAAAEDTSSWTDQTLTGTTLTLPSALATGTWLIEVFYVGSYFQMFTYTGTGANKTESYPATLDSFGMVHIFNRDISSNKPIQHSSLSATQYLNIHTSQAALTNVSAWNNTAATTTGVTVGTGATGTNQNGNAFIGYAWANSGPYAFGSYTGNANANGPMINVGGSPASTMIKRSSATENWLLLNDLEPGYNLVDNVLYPNLTHAMAVDHGTTRIDILSNGAKVRGTNTNINSGTYIYGAFGIQPIQGNGTDTSQGRAK